MGNKIILIIILLFFTNCSLYYKFDEYYDQGNYLKAYNLLENIKNKNDYHYQKRLIQVVIRLAIDGDTDFIDKLENIIKNYNLDSGLSNYILFGENLILFLRADNVNYYYQIITNFQNIKLMPEEFIPLIFKMRGISYYKIGNYECAITNLLESQKLQPNLENFYFLGLCYQNLEDYKNSKYYFGQIKDNTTNKIYISLAYYQIGEIYYIQNNIKDALENYIKAINYYPYNANYTDQIGKSLLKLKYNKLSQKFFKISLRIQKDDANAWFYLNLY